MTGLLSGCSWLHPYHPPIEQGNKLTTKQKQHIKKGMSQNQVIDLLGEPVLKTPWRNHQMLYVYTFKASNSAKLNVKQRIILSLKNGRVNHIAINS